MGKELFTEVCVDNAIEQVMEQGGQILYQKYLAAKVMPFSAKATLLGCA